MKIECEWLHWLGKCFPKNVRTFNWISHCRDGNANSNDDASTPLFSSIVVQRLFVVRQIGRTFITFDNCGEWLNQIELAQQEKRKAHTKRSHVRNCKLKSIKILHEWAIITLMITKHRTILATDDKPALLVVLTIVGDAKQHNSSNNKILSQ